MWSDKKYVNYIITVLVFLSALNIFHFGQLLLIPICFIIFIENKFVFYVNNKKLFIVLLLFATTFYVFSYKLGFYGLVSFVLPVSYYIGSNIKYPTENNIKTLIFIIAFGMMLMALLDFGYDFYDRGFELFDSQNHFDFWLRQKVSPTYIASFYVIPISTVYTTLFFEKNKLIKIVFLLLYTLLAIYEIGLGRRTPIFIFIISFFFSFIIQKRKIIIDRKKVHKLLIVTISVIAIFFLTNISSIIVNSRLVQKFVSSGLKSGRIEIAIESLKYLSKYPFGGKVISSYVGDLHNLWLDVYDYSGFLPFILILAYSLYVFINMFRVFRNKNNSEEFRMLVISFTICVYIENALEPVISGLTLLLAMSTIVFSCIEKNQLQNQK